MCQENSGTRRHETREIRGCLLIVDVDSRAPALKVLLELRNVDVVLFFDDIAGARDSLERVHHRKLDAEFRTDFFEQWVEDRARHKPAAFEWHKLKTSFAAKLPPPFCASFRQQ